MRNGIPSHDTFNRVLHRAGPEKVLECFWLDAERARQAVGQEIVALDGKALRQAIDGDGRIKYIVSAWAEGNNPIFGPNKSGRQEQRNHRRAPVAARAAG